MYFKNLALAFFSLLILIGCSDDDSSDGSQESNNSTDLSEYFYVISGKLDGEEFLYGQKMDATALNNQLLYSLTLEGATCAYSEEGAELHVSYGSEFYPNFENDGEEPAFGMDFFRFYSCTDDRSSTSLFNSLFSEGDYQFSADNEAYGTVKQIGISFQPIANNGSVFYTSYDGESQESGFFRITHSEEMNEYFLGDLHTQSQLIEGEFSVRVYNHEDSTDYKDITDAKFKIIVRKG